MKNGDGIAAPLGAVRAMTVWSWIPLAYWVGGLACYLHLVLIFGRRGRSPHG
jgi:hypothetical protein